MRAHRESAKGITASSQCLGTAKRVGDYTLGLAQFVRDNGPVSTAPGAAFNLSDLLRSSLVLDTCLPAYRAYLFRDDKPDNQAIITEQNKRDDLGVTFVQVYTHRQLGCLGCHNTVASTTGPQTFWNRHYPIRGRFTHGLYGQSTGRPADEVHAMLRTDVASGGLLPWGLSSCGSFVAAASVPNDTFTSPGGGPLNAFFVTPRGRKGSVWQLESSSTRACATSRRMDWFVAGSLVRLGSVRLLHLVRRVPQRQRHGHPAGHARANRAGERRAHRVAGRRLFRLPQRGLGRSHDDIGQLSGAHHGTDREH